MVRADVRATAGRPVTERHFGLGSYPEALEARQALHDPYFGRGPSAFRSAGRAAKTALMVPI